MAKHLILRSDRSRPSGFAASRRATNPRCAAVRMCENEGTNRRSAL